MTKRLVIWLSITILSFIVLVILANKLFFVEEDYRSPGTFSSYPNSGLYEIDPETILGVLNQGEIGVFTPFFGDWDRDEPHYDSIAWTQSEYLKITNALSQETWNEPLDLENWKLMYISLEQDCKENPRGFHTFTLVYYKPLGIINGERKYTTRLIEMFPWKGIIRWGGDAVFSAPLIPGWDSIDLNDFKITADDALQIAEKNGGRDARLKVDNNCQTALRITDNNWIVDYDRRPLA